MSESLDSSGTNMARMITFLRAHKRLITFSWVAFCAFWLTPSWSEVGPFGFLFFFALFVMLIVSQIFWVGRVVDLGERFIPGKPRRAWLTAIASVVCLFFFAYNIGLYISPWKIPRGDSTHLTLRHVLFEAPFWWWFVGSWVGFGLVMVFWMVDRAGRAAAWAYRKARKVAAGHAATPMPSAIALDPPSLARRRLLEQAAVAVSTVPFVAAAYGLLYERLDVEVTRRRIALARLPKGFQGFRIVQLSDFHISPFMTANEIRRCVTIAAGLKADLVVLTGDYLSDDPEAEGEVVQALAGLGAPSGVFGCLGNHEIYTETEDSITRLLDAVGIRILRQERVLIQSQGEVLNLIGVDYQQRRFSRDHDGHLVDRYLEGSEKLVIPDMVNILLSHNPNSFDRAAELGIDLTLAGHSHGGQLTLSFVNRGLTLVRPETPYVSGWYEKPAGQLYVNRGIGTTGPPIRLGARPEITVLELTRT
ncbi:MAG TPA: metallophosphoesterase [Candidatus Sulfotelmatobacter sp.]|nr:metallophosphoesterase [Candidatus Sulfotelmatobacter sp.]